MKLNEDERRFVLRWGVNYKKAIYNAIEYCEAFHRPYNPKKSLEDVPEELEMIADAYGSYKYWHGVLMGMIQTINNDIRPEIFAACAHALQNVIEAAYFPTAKFLLK